MHRNLTEAGEVECSKVWVGDSENDGDPGGSGGPKGSGGSGGPAKSEIQKKMRRSAMAMATGCPEKRSDSYHPMSLDLERLLREREIRCMPQFRCFAGRAGTLPE
jgi:hypothetical protein